MERFYCFSTVFQQKENSLEITLKTIFYVHFSPFATLQKINSICLETSAKFKFTLADGKLFAGKFFLHHKNAFLTTQ